MINDAVAAAMTAADQRLSAHGSPIKSPAPRMGTAPSSPPHTYPPPVSSHDLSYHASQQGYVAPVSPEAAGGGGMGTYWPSNEVPATPVRYPAELYPGSPVGHTQASVQDLPEWRR